MKKYVFCLAAALSFALGAAGAVFAASHTKSLVPSLNPQPARWLGQLAEHPRDPKPAHRPGGTTVSIYEQYPTRWILARQGCSAARHGRSGVVILDFGKPAYNGHRYGTITFSGRFAANWRITRAMLGYASGFAGCLPEGSGAFITVARGTSNYHPDVPSAYEAGVVWGRATNRFASVLAAKGLDAHVGSAAADDAEPAWDRRFHRTRDFFHGFRMASQAHTLYDYGSLDGGVGAIWSARQALFVSGGQDAAALPEIYNRAMAREWAELARIARSRFHRTVPFAGVMTQGTSRRYGLRPHEAYHALTHALDSVGVDPGTLPLAATDIVG